MNFRVFVVTPQNYLLWVGSVICVSVAKGSIPIMSTIRKEEYGGKSKAYKPCTHLFTPHVYNSRPLESPRLFGIVSSTVVL
jgi:hypothetical protein